VKCPLFGIDCPAAANSGTTAAFTAEYLSRLLKKDYAGEDEGVMERKLDRPDADRKTDEEWQVLEQAAMTVIEAGLVSKVLANNMVFTLSASCCK
jgi:hypothetical protein